ncbi:MAG: hypothetical protein B6244_00135 [Candidatus Cloacimonetes bacterium 4572_55]|nr:MAG: hypothetical protein B6244_00135 [Candidatus Cloacimonetes bacterium 4572_55]
MDKKDSARSYKIILNPVKDDKTKQIVLKKLITLTKKPESVIQSIMAKAPIVVFKSVSEQKARVIKKHFGSSVTLKLIGEKIKPARKKPEPPRQVAPPKPVEEPANSFGFSDEEQAVTPPPIPMKKEPVSPPPAAGMSIGFDNEPPPKSQIKPSMTHDASPSPPTPPPTPSPIKKKSGKAFKDNYKDNSDDKGFAYEFFCEQCEKGYRPDYFSIPSGIGYSISLFFKFFGKKLSGKMPHDLSWMREDEKKSFQRSSFNKSLKSAEAHFFKCEKCGKRVCSKCWNTSKKECSSCAPVSHNDLPGYMQKKIEKDKREKEERGRSKFCPGCGSEKVAAAKFCEVCGASYD